MKTFYQHIVRNLILAMCIVLYVPVLQAANVSEPDHNEIAEWKIIKELMFGNKEIKSGRNEVVALYLNTKLDDASTVPIMVNGLMDQATDKFIKKLYLIIDRNPIPTAGIFEFGPESGRVKLETRMRFEHFSFIRAVAETNDGDLYMDQRWVQVAGGCSAPSGKNLDDPSLGKMRFRMDDQMQIDQPNLVQFQIKHPNESALASDLDEGHLARFIDKISVDYNGKSVFRGDVNFSLSDNPIFKFYFLPKTDGVLSVKASDTHNTSFEDSYEINGSDHF